MAERRFVLSFCGGPVATPRFPSLITVPRLRTSSAAGGRRQAAPPSDIIPASHGNREAFLKRFQATGDPGPPDELNSGSGEKNRSDSN